MKINFTVKEAAVALVLAVSPQLLQAQVPTFDDVATNASGFNSSIEIARPGSACSMDGSRIDSSLRIRLVHLPSRCSGTVRVRWTPHINPKFF